MILAFVSALAMIMLELGSMIVLAQQLAGKYSIQVTFFALIEEIIRLAAICVLFFKIARSERALNLETILFVGVCIGGVEYFFHLLNWSIAPTSDACTTESFPPLCKNVTLIFPFFIHIFATFGYSGIVQLPARLRPLTLFVLMSGFLIALMVHAGLNLFIVQRADVPGYLGPTGFAYLIMGGSLIGLGVGHLLRKMIEAGRGIPDGPAILAGMDMCSSPLGEISVAGHWGDYSKDLPFVCQGIFVGQTI